MAAWNSSTLDSFIIDNTGFSVFKKIVYKVLCYLYFGRWISILKKGDVHAVSVETRSSHATDASILSTLLLARAILVVQEVE
jgi:hypothetical protein